MPERQLRIIRKRLFVITITLSVALIGAFALASYSIYAAHAAASHDRMTLCRAQNNSGKAVRDILLLAESIVKKAHDIPPRERLRSVRFYDKALTFVRPIDCPAVSSNS